MFNVMLYNRDGCQVKRSVRAQATVVNNHMISVSCMEAVGWYTHVGGESDSYLEDGKIGEVMWLTKVGGVLPLTGHGRQKITQVSKDAGAASWSHLVKVNLLRWL